MRKEIVLCEHCGNKTSHTILYQGIELEDFVEVDNETNKMKIPFAIWFTNCDTCKHHSLFTSLNDTADEATSVFPSRKRLSDNVPKTISNAYREALKVKRHSNYAYIVLVRRALELTCNQENAEGPNLAAKIKDLGKKGIIPSKLTDMADVIRLVGNSGAHSHELKVDEYEISILDNFFLTIVDYIYCIHHSVEALRKKITVK